MFFGDLGRSWASKKYLINLWQINEAHATFLLFYKCINIVFLHHNLEIKGCANFCPKKVEILEDSFLPDHIGFNWTAMQYENLADFSTRKLVLFYGNDSKVYPSELCYVITMRIIHSYSRYCIHQQSLRLNKYFQYQNENLAIHS